MLGLQINTITQIPIHVSSASYALFDIPPIFRLPVQAIQAR